MKRSIFAATSAAMLVTAVFAYAPAHAAAIDPAATTISAQLKQLGVPVTGRFKKLTGSVEFDAQQLAKAKGTVDIDVASFDLGDKDYNAEVAKKDWFDAKAHPKATFTLGTVTTAGSQYKATGKLSIKGKTLDINFPVTIKAEHGQQVFEGQVPVKRTFFNIGEGEWKDTSIVADEVIIKFKIVAAK